MSFCCSRIPSRIPHEICHHVFLDFLVIEFLRLSLFLVISNCNLIFIYLWLVHIIKNLFYVVIGHLYFFHVNCSGTVALFFLLSIGFHWHFCQKSIDCLRIDQFWYSFFHSLDLFKYQANTSLYWLLLSSISP